ncbi:MAG: GxxExxY protein [Gracilimonas sp.]|uniref:GxxExxY protein n=1 Tax=Gracilimonas sp. TaxID=1974203 RepID=UPI003751D3F6|nr:GxxExxY protein [Gracilimonas sp.]
MLHEKLTERIIECFYNVYNSLGFGFLENVYEKSLLTELKENGLKCNPQVPVNVYYKKQLVGKYFADIIVEELIILELKAIERLRREHEVQILNYLKATEIEVGLVLNFGYKPQIKRKIYTNDRKKHLK